MGSKETFLGNVSARLKEIIKLGPYKLLGFRGGGSIEGGSVEIVSVGIAARQLVAMGVKYVCLELALQLEC